MFNTAATKFGAIPRPAFGRSAQHQQATHAPRRTKAEVRYQRAAQTAAELLPELPAIGEAIHCLMLGSFDLAQVITATLKLIPTCRTLRIATLAFSKRNAAEMLGWLETYPQMQFRLLASEFFRSKNKELFEKTTEELADRADRAKLAAARSHCKVVTFDMGPCDGLVWEGSPNLRTNGNREQLAVIRDRGLHDFHSAWIDELVNADERGKARDDQK